MAMLADSVQPEGRTTRALTSRAKRCLGHDASEQDPRPLPESLFEQLLRLSTMSASEWVRLEPEDLATWFCYGYWRRKAGVRNSSVQPLPPEHASQETEDGDYVLAGEYDTHPTPPLHQWTAPQLGQAFRTWAASPHSGMPLRWLLRSGTGGPQPAWMGRGSKIPVLASAHDIAQALNVPLEDLLWLAPEHAQWREPQGGGHALHPSHYRYRLLPKPSGGLRLLEAPRPRLATIQRHILDTLLKGVPTHEAAHGFVRGRSVGSHAQIHTNQAVVIRFDLTDFFTSINATRIRALWRALGHGRPVADLLTRLTTARTPQAIRERLLEATPIPPQAIARRRAIAARLAQPHLPQGAPTSPNLANLCAFGLDLRMHALAERFGARYTRYADDLVFSGPKALHGQFETLLAWVSAIAQDEGFTLRADKTRVMPAHQRQYVTGLVVNQRVNYSRTQFDTLKARLHRLAGLPQVDASERAQVAGEIHWASQWLASTRKDKLMRLFDTIRFATTA